MGLRGQGPCAAVAGAAAPTAARRRWREASSTLGRGRTAVGQVNVFLPDPEPAKAVIGEISPQIIVLQTSGAVIVKEPLSKLVLIIVDEALLAVVAAGAVSVSVIPEVSDRAGRVRELVQAVHFESARGAVVG
jgi:hypothetical protein